VTRANLALVPAASNSLDFPKPSRPRPGTRQAGYKPKGVIHRLFPFQCSHNATSPNGAASLGLPLIGYRSKGTSLGCHVTDVEVRESFHLQVDSADFNVSTSSNCHWQLNFWTTSRRSADSEHSDPSGSALVTLKWLLPSGIGE
jgi:hypothetical protein